MKVARARDLVSISTPGLALFAQKVLVEEDQIVIFATQWLSKDKFCRGLLYSKDVYIDVSIVSWVEI